jgi:hypothetical protein
MVDPNMKCYNLIFRKNILINPRVAPLLRKVKCKIFFDRNENVNAKMCWFCK